MRIDASRYSLFLSNPDEYRLRYCWNLSPTSGGNGGTYTYGRRRGTFFHELSDGKSAEELAYLGEDVQATAEMMDQANQRYSAKVNDVVLWSEKEFDIPIPDSPHRMVGRIDRLVDRYDEKFILDFKTSKHRSKEEFRYYREEKEQSPQVDFYLLACPEASKLVYRVLSKHPKPPKSDPNPIKIFEIDCFRAKWELKAFQHSVHMVCSTIEQWTKEHGIERPWPRAKWVSEFSGYRPLYQRNVYDAPYDGFGRREEHLEVMKNAV